MKKIHYTPLLLLSFIFGCSDANIDLVKQSRLTADENYTIEQAFDNRKLCEGIEWISTTDDVGRDIVEYHCNLIKPIAAINDAELKNLEESKKNLPRDLKRLNKRIDEAYEYETDRIERTKKDLEYIRRNFNEKQQELKETLSKIEEELSKDTIDSLISEFEHDYEIQNKLREYKNQEYMLELNIDVEYKKTLPELKQIIAKLEKVLTHIDTEKKITQLLDKVKYYENQLEQAKQRTESNKLKNELEEKKKNVENSDITDFTSIQEVFKFLVIDEETINVIEAGLVFEIDEDGEEKTIYKKYSDRQLYLHIEDIYEPNAFSSTIRLRHYNSFLK